MPYSITLPTESELFYLTEPVTKYFSPTQFDNNLRGAFPFGSEVDDLSDSLDREDGYYLVVVLTDEDNSVMYKLPQTNYKYLLDEIKKIEDSLEEKKLFQPTQPTQPKDLPDCPPGKLRFDYSSLSCRELPFILWAYESDFQLYIVSTSDNPSNAGGDPSDIMDENSFMRGLIDVGVDIRLVRPGQTNDYFDDNTQATIQTETEAKFDEAVASFGKDTDDDIPIDDTTTPSLEDEKENRCAAACYLEKMLRELDNGRDIGHFSLQPKFADSLCKALFLEFPDGSLADKFSPPKVASLTTLQRLIYAADATKLLAEDNKNSSDETGDSNSLSQTDPLIHQIDVPECKPETPHPYFHIIRQATPANNLRSRLPTLQLDDSVRDDAFDMENILKCLAKDLQRYVEEQDSTLRQPKKPQKEMVLDMLAANSKDPADMIYKAQQLLTLQCSDLTAAENENFENLTSYYSSLRILVDIMEVVLYAKWEMVDGFGTFFSPDYSSTSYPQCPKTISNEILPIIRKVAFNQISAVSGIERIKEKIDNLSLNLGHSRSSETQDFYNELTQVIDTHLVDMQQNYNAGVPQPT